MAICTACRLPVSRWQTCGRLIHGWGRMKMRISMTGMGVWLDEKFFHLVEKLLPMSLTVHFNKASHQFQSRQSFDCHFR